MLKADRWMHCWSVVGANDPSGLEKLFSELMACYNEGHRHYHTVQHLEECFEVLGHALHLATHPSEVEIALWFHDAIYDTHKSDNELRSAEWARDSASSFGVHPEISKRIYDFIMFTRHTVEPIGIDAQVLIDVDLAILGAQPDRFQEYERQIRKEYEWVPEPLFRLKRAEVLQNFLSRPHIYSTEPFRHHFESQARRNIENAKTILQLNG